MSCGKIVIAGAIAVSSVLLPARPAPAREDVAPAPPFSRSLVELGGAKRSFNLLGRTIAVVVGAGAEFREAADIPSAWRSWGARVITVGPSRTVAAHEYLLTDRGLTPVAREIAADVLLDEFDEDAADVIYFPGGDGPEDLLTNHRERVLGLARGAVRSGKTVAAFCHGPAIIVAAGLAEGREIAGEVPPEEVVRAGGVFSPRPWVADGPVITGAYPYLETFAAGVAARLSGRPAAEASAAGFGPDGVPFAIPTAYRFDGRPVPEEAIRTMVRAASRTAQDGFLNAYKPWRVVALRDPASKEAFRAAAAPKLDAFYAARGMPEARRALILRRIVDAPALLLVTMEKRWMDPFLGRCEVDAGLLGRNLALSAGAFTANLRVAAVGLGLGASQLGGLPVLVAEEEIRSALGLGPDVSLAAVVSVGYPVRSLLPQPPRPVEENLVIK